MYADLHCHPGAVAYDQNRFSGNIKQKLSLDPWHIPQSNLHGQRRGMRATDYSQCDLAKSTKAGVKLMFAALYPIEKGFFAGISGGKMGKKKITEYYRRVATEGEILAIEWLVSSLRTQPGAEKLESTALGFLQDRNLNLSFDHIQYIQNGNYDYFEELKREYKFYLTKAGQPATTSQQLQLEPEGLRKNWEGCYQLAQDGNDVTEKIESVNKDVVMVFTIDGIHSLGVGNPEDEYLRPGEERKDVSISKLKSRVRQLKGEEPLDDTELKRWEHRPFFITFAHHFNNALCGHAHSLSSTSRLVFDQRKNMDKGVLKHVTYEVMQELLGLDTELNVTGSKRILIDVKHMSAASRFDFYNRVIRPFNNKKENYNIKIPIIASHVGFSGVASLQDQINNAYNGKEDDNFRINRFNAWNINLCDEDVIEIHKSRGLIGLSFDQRILGADRLIWFINLPINTTIRKQAMNAFGRTIEEFVRIPFAYNLENPGSIWDELCLGTDFEGFIDPISRYNTVLQFRTFEEDLIEILDKLKRQQPHWFNGYSSETLARKICFENAYGFVKKHY